jgi:hypothetical protein
LTVPLLKLGLIDKLGGFLYKKEDKYMESAIIAVDLQARFSQGHNCEIHNRAKEYKFWLRQTNKSPLGNHANDPIQLSRHDRTVAWLFILVVLVTLLSGCGLIVHDRAAFEPGLLSSSTSSSPYKLTGKVLVLTDSQDDQRISSIAPESFFGGLTRLEIPLGAIAGESARSAFDGLFTDGADWLNPPAQFANYAFVVRPYVSSFSYHWENTFSGPVVAVMETTVSVSILDNSGNMIWEHSYQSGPFRGEPVEPPIDNAQDRSPAIHQKIQELMDRAALDFSGTQFRKIAPSWQE